MGLSGRRSPVILLLAATYVCRTTRVCLCAQASQMVPQYCALLFSPFAALCCISFPEPRAELGRYVKWPKYIRIQRQRKILYQRLKVPPSINQFTNTLDKNLCVNLFKLLHKYRPEDGAQKKERLAAMAVAKVADEESTKKPLYLKYGINHITKLCEEKKAQLVCISHDVDPIEVRF